MKLMVFIAASAFAATLLAGCYTQLGTTYDDRARSYSYTAESEPPVDTSGYADNPDGYAQDRDRLYYDYYQPPYAYDPYYYQPWYRPWLAFGGYDPFFWGSFSYAGWNRSSYWSGHNGRWGGYGGLHGGQGYYGQPRNFGNGRNIGTTRAATVPPVTYTPYRGGTIQLPNGSRSAGSYRRSPSSVVPPAAGARQGADRSGGATRTARSRMSTTSRGSAPAYNPPSPRSGGNSSAPATHRGNEGARPAAPAAHPSPPSSPPSNSGGGGRGSESRGGGGGGSHSGNRR